MPFPPPPDTTPEPDEADLVFRPYTVTAGRTRPVRGRFDLASIVSATQPVAALESGHTPEQLAILHMSQQPTSVAELSAHLTLPAAVVRVLLGDLLDAGLITVSELYSASDRHAHDTLEAIRDGLRAL
jgi:DNA-binding transcriptional ArsR family regulator